MLPNELYTEALVPDQDTNTRRGIDKDVLLRFNCKVLPDVAGVKVKDHFEVGWVSMDNFTVVEERYLHIHITFIEYVLSRVWVWIGWFVDGCSETFISILQNVLLHMKN